MHSSSSLLTTLKTIEVATTRVLPSLLTTPPPPITEFYHTYVALNPIVTHFYLTLLFIFFSLPLALVATSTSISSPYQVFVTLTCTLLYVFHPYLSEDNRTSKFFDSRLVLFGSLISFYFLRCILQVLDPSFRSKQRYRYLKERAEILRITGRAGLCVSKIISFAFQVGLSSLLVAPMYLLWMKRGTELRLMDTVITGFSLTTVMGIRRGMCTYRNGTCKLIFWGAIYAATIAIGMPIVNWTATGVSIFFMELLVSGRLFRAEIKAGASQTIIMEGLDEKKRR